MAKLSAYDKFLKDKILPAMVKALRKEDRTLRKQFKKTEYRDFYEPDEKSISSYLLTERTIQYVIFKELCVNFKLFPEYLAYGKTKKRIDLAIYKNISDYEKTAEIGVEIKQVTFTKSETLTADSIQHVVNDFAKIKDAKTPHKYLLLLGRSINNVKPESITLQFKSNINNTLFRKYTLSVLDIQSFKSPSDHSYDNLNLVIVKISEA